MKEFKQKGAFCLMRYESKDGTSVEYIWNSQNCVTPFIIIAKDGKTEMSHTRWKLDEFKPNYILQPGDRYFGKITLEKAEEYAEKRMKSMDGSEYEVQGEQREEIKKSVIKSMLNDECPDLITFIN